LKSSKNKNAKQKICMFVIGKNNNSNVLKRQNYVIFLYYR
jgi:hypothetical protein